MKDTARRDYALEMISKRVLTEVRQPYLWPSRCLCLRLLQLLFLIELPFFALEDQSHVAFEC
jgi:hypothetical protein